MSVDTSIKLPSGVAVRDVAKVIALLLGKPRTWTDCSKLNNCVHGLTQPTAHGWVDVEGVSYESSSGQPECCTINIKDIPAMYGDGWWFFYHFEYDGGHRGMMGGSRAERIALHRRLAEVFGGVVDYADCDAKDIDYRCKAPSWVGKSDDDAQFHKKELAFWAITPITQEEIAECEQWASYKRGRR